MTKKCIYIYFDEEFFLCWQNLRFLILKWKRAKLWGLKWKFSDETLIIGHWFFGNVQVQAQLEIVCSVLGDEWPFGTNVFYCHKMSEKKKFLFHTKKKAKTQQNRPQPTYLLPSPPNTANQPQQHNQYFINQKQPQEQTGISRMPDVDTGL